MSILNGAVYSPVRPHMVGEQLPYFEFEEDPKSPLYRVHLLNDGSLGVCWKTPVPHSYSVDNGAAITVRELRSFVEGLPSEYELQIIITSHNNLVSRMRQYLSQDMGSDRGQILRQSRAEKLLDAGFRYYEVGNDRISKLRETYMVITMRTPEQTAKLGALSVLVDALLQVVGSILSVVGIKLSDIAGKLLDDVLRLTLAEFQEALMTAENALTSMFKLERMTLAELKEHYWTAYCPSYREVGQEITIDPLRPFNEQVIPLPIENDHHIVKIGNDYQGVVTLAMMPDMVDIDYLGAIRRTLTTQHTVFMCVSGADQTIEKIKLTAQAWLRSRAATVLSRESSQIVQQESSQVRARLFEGSKIMYLMLGVIVHGYSREEVEDRMLRLSAMFKKLSAVPDVEKSMALQAIAYSFPLGWRKRFSRPFARTRRVVSDDLCDLIPIHGHWGGHKNSQSVYVNRDGEITFFDHTSPDFINWHYAITGSSGSGKTFAVVDLVLQLFAGGVKRQFLMSIKDDYDRFAQTMGKLIVIDLDRQENCINPFTGTISKNRLQQWAQAVELMIQRGQFETGRIENRLIEQVVQYAYDIVPADDILRPTWIREAFFKFPYADEEQRQAGHLMAHEMGSYCEEGIYGRLFDGPPSVTEDDRLVVFNLMNVLNEKTSDVIIHAIFTMLDNVMYLGDRGEKKHLLVDEMISMLSSKGGAAVANQLKRAFRTYRSLNCMCGIATQNEEDLTTDVGQAIIGNITKRMILKPRREMVPMLVESLGLKGERHKESILSLEPKPGFYSEFYLTSPDGEVVCRLIPDPLTYALATTTPDDVREMTRMRNDMGGNLWDSTLLFAQTYPHGVRAARSQKSAA